MTLTASILARADDNLILGHRLSEWCGHAPMLEQDMALSNIGLDLIGQARLLYTYAAEREGPGHDEDRYAFFRDAPDFRNLLITEHPNGDFAVTMLRQFLYSAYADLWWRALTRSTDATLAAIAAKAEKETAYHLRHSAEWVIRLGDGTEESHRRAQTALNTLWPLTAEMFEAVTEHALIDVGILPDPIPLRTAWRTKIDTVLHEATLTLPAPTPSQTGGRAGRHTQHLLALLTEMQHIARAHPGAIW